MKKRTLILVTLLVTIVMGITAQKIVRQLEVNKGGKVIAVYELPNDVDSLTFTAINLYTVVVNAADASQGTATTSSDEVKQNRNVTITATPNEGYKFVNWTVNGEVVSTENPYTTKVTANIEYIANFTVCYTDNGYEWVDLGLPSGLKWAAFKNLQYP